MCIRDRYIAPPNTTDFGIMFLPIEGLFAEVLREPGSTLAGEKIRDILLDNDSKLSSETELLLMFSARSELVNKIILDNKSDYLLLDRFFDASMAYQGYGRELSKEFINSLISFINSPIPDHTFLLDISVAVSYTHLTLPTKRIV